MEKEDIFREKQIGVEEQKVILHALADSVTDKGCKILEIGSWCGESSAILGKIAKEKNGRLFCIDWWKGNIGMELEQIAKNADIFSIFWKNMQKEGIDDAVIPIRARSDTVPDILQKEFFDFIYMDADHRYKAALNDIKLYAPLLKTGGIICGDDCEGYVSDYDMHFLNEGKLIDCHESVHCGVVLAVAEKFPAYSINYNIWSARKTFNGWEPTNISFDLIKDKRQYQPPLVGIYKEYNLMRYGRLIYAVPQHLEGFDVTNEQDRRNPVVITGETIHEVKAVIHEKKDTGFYLKPRLIENYIGFNIVRYQDEYYACDVSLGDIDISAADMSEYQKSFKCFMGYSIAEVKDSIDNHFKKVQIQNS